jgi:AAA+ ATPase superfamily predicted ATPase
MEFVDREQELSFLQEKWRQNQAQFIVLWGKRRVGKTELVKQFIKGKPNVYFLSESTSNKEQLLRFSRAMGEFFQEPLLTTRGFAEWEEIFSYVSQKKKRFVLAVDEFPYLISSNPAILSLFQKAWDEYWSKSNIFLILLGSSIAMMENEVLGYRSPLYGRRTGQWRVEPMPFTHIRQFRKAKNFDDILCHFGAAGGIPAYWLKFDKKNSFEENLKEKVLKKVNFSMTRWNSFCGKNSESHVFILPSCSNSTGKRKLSEIVNATGITLTSANKYLGVLSDLKLVERELPITEEKPLKSKKGLSG